MAQSAPNLPGMEPGVELIGRINPYVRQCGDSHRKAWCIPERRLLDNLLVYIAEGTGEFTIGEETYDAQPKDLFWIPPNTIHIMEGFPPRMHCPYVHFDLVYRPEVCHWEFSIPHGMTDLSDFEPLMHPDMSHMPELRFPGRIRQPNNERVGNLIIEIAREATRAQPYTALRLSALMIQVVAELLRGRAGLSNELGAHIPALERAAGYVHKHLDEELSVQELADICELSVSHFRQLFAKHYGRSPRDYIRLARVGKAKGLMIGSQMSLTEIARRTGFSTVHNLSRAFRALEGIAPSQYRRCGQPAMMVEGRGMKYATR